MNELNENTTSPASSKIGVYALAPFVSKWQNQHLLKDCGLVPYMLHKVYGYDVTMVGCRHGEYPYIDEYLHGMKMDFLPDCHNDDELSRYNTQYVKEHYQSMDILILNAPYKTYYETVHCYRELRPDGKIYIGLDANSYWMDRLNWKEEWLYNLLNACDVIATSCRKMQTMLNAKWTDFKVEFIPNGFINLTNIDTSVQNSDKENIILTVARIGTEQKANHIMLEAFAAVHKLIPDWKMHLVGNIESSFNSYIDEYFERFPELRDKVIFKGLVESKHKLYEEYKKSKIFVLSSTFEGSPNVIAEALSYGCYTITSDIDASYDITNYEKCGRIFPINDTARLADIFVQVCNDKNLLDNAISQSVKYAERYFDWETNIKKVNYLLMKDRW